MHIRNVLLSLMLLCSCIGCSSTETPSTRVVKLNPAPARDSEKARGLNQKATGLIAASDFDDAERLLQQAIKADEDFGPAQNNLGVVYYNQSKPYQAAQQFMLAAALMPNDPEPRNGMGLVMESSGRFDDAINYYDRAHALDPANIEYVGNSARARVRRGDQTEELRNMLTSLAENDPREAWNSWAREALRRMDRSPATNPAGNNTNMSK